ncbi:MAG: PqiC family protein [Candidatus Binatia bacterium]|nr:PqiC family protein [Candidatus Binatia bacterium]
MRRSTRLVWSVVVLCGVITQGCSLTRARPAVRYYSLSIALPEPAPGAGTLSLVVRPFTARDPYDRNSMVYRQSPYQLDFYQYHRWAATPAQQVTEWTRRYLGQSGVFAKVFPTPDATADLALSGIIRQFEEIDHQHTWEAALSIDFWLTRGDQRTPLWFRSYAATQQAAKRNPAAIAEAMSRNLETILRQLIADLAAAIAPLAPREPPQRSQLPEGLSTLPTLTGDPRPSLSRLIDTYPREIRLLF